MQLSKDGWARAWRGVRTHTPHRNHDGVTPPSNSVDPIGIARVLARCKRIPIETDNFSRALGLRLDVGSEGGEEFRSEQCRLLGDGGL